MKKNELEKYEISGQLAAELREKLSRQVKPGVKLGVLADAAENVISELGPKFRPAFPLNISINEVAAHDTARIDDPRSIPPKALVKIDLGVSYDGYLSDCARTIMLGMNRQSLVKSSLEALDKAIEVIKPGLRVKEIGNVIESTIQEYGFEPIRNLSGHLIERYSLHAGLSIPNTPRHLSFRENKKLEEGMIIAIEPFATESKEDTYVIDGGKPQIFRVPNGRIPHTSLGKKWLQIFGTVPFSARMAARLLTNKKNAYKRILNTVRREKFQEYPPLVDMHGGLISQAEDTVYVGKFGAKVLTRR